MAERKHSSQSGRVPPQAIEVEQAVLGAMLLEKEAIGRALEIIDKDCFYRDDHQKIFDVLVDLYDKNQPVDIITVSEELTSRKQLDELGGRMYLLELTEKIATTANIEYHCNIVLEKSTLRKLINTSAQIVSQCYDSAQDVDDLLDRAEQGIFSISEKRIKEGFVPLGDLLPHTFEEIEGYQKKGGLITGIPTGFFELDYLTGGLQKSDLIVVASRPSMGKTSLCLTIAESVAIDAKIPVGIFSLEMSKNQVVQRMLCSRARFSTHKMRTGKIRDEDYSNLAMAVGPLAEAKIFVDDTPSIGILQLRAKSRRLKAQHDVGLIIVDYLQLMQGPRSAESRQQEISTISRSLKGLAKELDVPVIAVSQLSRKVEDRGGEKRPMLADLRESGAIEQDADVVMFIYRPELYKIEKFRDETPTLGLAEIMLEKHRNGPTGDLRLTFLKDCARFANPEFIRREVPF
ncbi:MAG: replicative DNA helicase [candidate division Zixibacteria bacterium SM23_73_3]|nr:MAG: replicative DNA helicase [candidate division Zixibacteria bacterium SM23_73_3]